LFENPFNIGFVDWRNVLRLMVETTIEEELEKEAELVGEPWIYKQFQPVV